jgi:Tfp pilus assembly protein PilX
MSLDRARTRRLSDEDGQSLVIALLVMTFLAISLGAVMFFSAGNQRNANYQKAAQLATSLAEGGVNNAVSVLAQAAAPGDPGNAHLIPDTNGNSSLLPSSEGTAVPKSYSGGTVKWWGTVDSNWLWTLHGKAWVSNPTGPSASQIAKTVTAQVLVNQPLPKPIDLGVWNSIYSPYGISGLAPLAGCDTSIGQNVVVSVKLYVGGNLCLGQGAIVNAPLYVGGYLYYQNKQSAVGCTQLTPNGCANNKTSPVSSAHIGGYCQVSSSPAVPTCRSEPVPNGSPPTNIWVAGAPASLTGTASDFIDPVTNQLITAPQICWAQNSCTGDPDGGWYTVSSPGPMHPCTTVSGAPPVFDNDATWGPNEGMPDGSVTTDQNLTPPNQPYTCKTAHGELSWNGTNTLTVVGTVFIDGSVSVTDQNAVIKYTGWGGSSGNCTNNGDCQAVIFVSGSVTIGANGHVALCGMLSGSNCDTTNWNPNANLLIFVANGSNGINVSSSQTQFQGGLYATKTITVNTTATTDGPLISGTRVVSLGQQSGGSFPPFTALPVAVQGPPQAFYISPPTNFHYGS